MECRFDLIEEPWLPCIMKNDAMVELGIRDCLVRAHEIRELLDPSPLVTISLHRLLLAILHRIHNGPENVEQWKAIWEPGHFDVSLISGYLEQWRHRFDLFHPERPFYQDTYVRDEGDSSVLRLAQERACGNNPTLFDHNLDDEPPFLLASQAARLLVTAQAFSLSGLAGPGREQFRQAPLVGGYSVLVQGDSLFETLMLNLVEYNEFAPDTLPKTSHDLPVWEMDVLPQPKRSTTPDGYINYLTWQSRRVFLHPKLKNGSTGVQRAAILQGCDLNRENILDPLRCYVRDEKRGFVPRYFKEGRVVWRDCHTLMQLHDTEDKNSIPPAAIKWIARLVSRRVIPGECCYRVAIYGFLSDKANVFLWRQERLPLPLSLITQPRLISDLENVLMYPEKSEHVLVKSVENILAFIQAPDDGRINDQDRRDQIRKRAFESTRVLWSRLESAFHECLISLSVNRDETFESWKTRVESATRLAFDEATRDLDGSARTLKARAYAANKFRYEMYRVMNPEGGVTCQTHS